MSRAYRNITVGMRRLERAITRSQIVYSVRLRRVEQSSCELSCSSVFDIPPGDTHDSAGSPRLIEL